MLMMTYYKKLTFCRRQYEDNDNRNHPHEARQRNRPHLSPTFHVPTNLEQRLNTPITTSQHRRAATTQRLARLATYVRTPSSHPSILQRGPPASPRLAASTRMAAPLRISNSKPAPPLPQPEIRSAVYALVVPVGDCVCEKGDWVE